MIRETWFPALHPCPAACPWVLLPGLGLSGRYLHRLARALTHSADVWIAEFHGSLHTKNFARITVAEIARAAGEWMERRGLGEVILVGHSFGAQVAVAMTLERPGLVKRLVLISPSVDEAARTVRQQLGRLVLDAFREPFTLLLFAALCYMRSGIRAWKMLRAALHDPLECSLCRVSQPALILRGVRDFVVSAPWTARLAGLKAGVSLITVPGAAHGVVYSHPRAVAEAVVRFAAATA